MLRGARRDTHNGNEALLAFVKKHKENQDVVAELVDHYKRLKNYEAGAQVVATSFTTQPSYTLWPNFAPSHTCMAQLRPAFGTQKWQSCYNVQVDCGAI